MTSSRSLLEKVHVSHSGPCSTGPMSSSPAGVDLRCFSTFSSFLMLLLQLASTVSNHSSHPVIPLPCHTRYARPIRHNLYDTAWSPASAALSACQCKTGVVWGVYSALPFLPPASLQRKTHLTWWPTHLSPPPLYR